HPARSSISSSSDSTEVPKAATARRPPASAPKRSVSAPATFRRCSGARALNRTRTGSSADCFPPARIGRTLAQINGGGDAMDSMRRHAVALAFVAATACSALADDGIALTLDRGATVGSAVLNWAGSVPNFDVDRGGNPATVATAGNLLAILGARTLSDNAV